MDKLLNRGFNFSVLPNKMDLTQILTDFKSLERNMVWTEFFYGTEENSEYEPPIFKTTKNNMPKNHSTPEGLKVFLTSLKSEITDPKNRNREECNLPVDELNALKELITLQKDRVIVIKACDKGAGIMILNFNDYMKACYEHLWSKTKDNKPYYKEVDNFEIDRSKAKIRTILEEMFENNIISRLEFNAMCADDKSPGRFYCNFKVHKPHAHKTAPPVRPILSGSGSITEGIATFVEHHIQPLSVSHDTYLQDTPHFLRLIQNINKGPKLKKNAMLVTWDVEGLYTNIEHEDGLRCLQDILQDKNENEVPYQYIMKLMKIILYNNIFTFHDSHWKQEIGAAMGSRPIPSYANNFMAKTIDPAIKKLAMQHNKEAHEALQLLKRFLDDYFGIFNGTTKSLHLLWDQMNKIHPSIKLTMSHTSVFEEDPNEKCECEVSYAIPFLDTLCSIKDGRIETDLYRKKTDRNQYLLPSSCHPKVTTKAIPHSLALRIVRICSEPKQRDIRLEEMKLRLIQRGYPEQLLDNAIRKAKRVPRSAALKKVIIVNPTKRPVFVVTYDPRLPSVSSIQAKHWRSMVNRDKYLAEVFPSPPLTAYRRQPNLRSNLVRATVAKGPNRYPKRNQWGMKKCNQPDCAACPYIREGNNITINGTQWRIMKKLDCNSYNIVYAIVCKKDTCKQVYLGETKRQLKSRLADHRGYVGNKDTTATGQHFNSPGHSIADLSITAIEQVKKNNIFYRKEREELHIRRFNTLYKGLNRRF